MQAIYEHSVAVDKRDHPFPFTLHVSVFGLICRCHDSGVRYSLSTRREIYVGGVKQTPAPAMNGNCA